MSRFMKRLVSAVVAGILAFSMGTGAFAAVRNTGFADVAADAWYADAVAYVQDNGLMSGTGDALFAPDAGMTPAMIATFLTSYDFSGKTIVPFCTSASDDIDNSLHIFTELCPEADIAEGLTANNTEDLVLWIDSLAI